MVLLNAPANHSFLDTLKAIDTWLFLKINGQWTNGFFNSIAPMYRDMVTWMPLYLFLLVFILLNFGMKAWPWILALIVTVVITDQGSNVIKDFFGRTRPCNDDAMAPYIHLLLNRCPGSKSFTSNHASNHFGAAWLLYLTLKPYIKKWAGLFFVWAATVSYAQVYVGVHYPFDVLGGAVFGTLVGCGIAYVFNRFIGLKRAGVSADGKLV